MSKIIEMLAGRILFARRNAILGGGGRVKEQTYYYQYE